MITPMREQMLTRAIPVHSRAPQSLRNSKNMDDDGLRSASTEGLSSSNASTQDEAHESGPSCPVSPPPLPQDWVTAGHNSGGIVYLHKPTRTCTWARPYCVPQSKTIKQHSVPWECVPCLHQSLLGPASHPLVERWSSDKEGQKAKLKRIKPHRLREYLLLRWSPNELSEATSKDAKPNTEDVSAKTITLLPEKGIEGGNVSSGDIDKDIEGSDKDTEGADKDTEGVDKDTEGADKDTEGADKDTEGTDKDTEGSDKGSTVRGKTSVDPDKGCSSLVIPKHLRKLILDRTGKCVPKVWSGSSILQSPLALLNQVCQGILKIKPDIAVVECEGKDEKPYSASISLDSVWYGSGTGSTKKLAKQEAAEAVLGLLFDGMLPNQEVAPTTLAKPPVETEDRADLGCSSWQILKCCLLRNRDTLPGKDAISLETHLSSAGQLMFSMSLGDRCHVEGHCVDGVEPCNTATEALLLKLHPYVKDWPTLARMYSGCVEIAEGETRKRHHTEEGEGVVPAKRGKWPSQSDTSLLERLKAEMKALSREYEATRDPTDHSKKTVLLDTDSPGFSSFSI